MEIILETHCDLWQHTSTLVCEHRSHAHFSHDNQIQHAHTFTHTSKLTYIQNMNVFIEYILCEIGLPTIWWALKLSIVVYFLSDIDYISTQVRSGDGGDETSD